MALTRYSGLPPPTRGIRSQHRCGRVSAGLPPPTRGIPRRTGNHPRIGRSTPAHAGNTRLNATAPRLHTVYPRPRGEYRLRAIATILAGGLPPPTRGIPLRLRYAPPPRRSTPAHAGNTRVTSTIKQSPKVYPRPRGEYMRQSVGSRYTHGLPPPTRGIRGPQSNVQRGRRSTPAHAGNTTASYHPYRPPMVYPRPRGEYRPASALDYHAKGLPPPTRGIHDGVWEAFAEGGSTPAHAGNTLHPKRTLRVVRVYPRPRGEYNDARAAAGESGGLPPPTRGIHGYPSVHYRAGRSTPAHAGNTARPTTLWASSRVYPRPRGEYTAWSSSALRALGLPPPTRGIRGGSACLGRCARSTPAHAGNTAAHTPRARRTRVYPRPRGEYLLSLALFARDLGLPPPTRGIPELPAQQKGAARSTPAHAGNTKSGQFMGDFEKVYPRPRGEYIMLRILYIAQNGLPPPTRGILAVAVFAQLSGRSTPAHAGNTGCKSAARCWIWVYPRPRGEYLPAPVDGFTISGLPPPTRGIRCLCGPRLPG